jgi:hypothetical protein
MLYVCTFIFANVFERKGAASVFSFDYADLAKGSLANDAQETEMVQVH